MHNETLNSTWDEIPLCVGVGLYCLISVFSVYSIVENALFVTTLPVNETARGLAIKLDLIDGRLIDTNLMFEYRNNPEFDDIKPRDHLNVWVIPAQL